VLHNAGALSYKNATALLQLIRAMRGMPYPPAFHDINDVITIAPEIFIFGLILTVDNSNERLPAVQLPVVVGIAGYFGI
jgi:hypothetical protein